VAASAATASAGCVSARAIADRAGVESPNVDSHTTSGPAKAAVQPQRTLEQGEIEMIRAALDAADGNISVAAKRLGISRNTIYRKMRWNQP
jgi:transcriptional regulator of acetoin/glycerol metabolism